jgi:hypothetical protein
VVRDGRLGQPEGLGEVADARLAAFVRGDHGDQPQPGGVGEGLEHAGEVGGLAGGDRLAAAGCRAGPKQPMRRRQSPSSRSAGLDLADNDQCDTYRDYGDPKSG